MMYVYFVGRARMLLCSSLFRDEGFRIPCLGTASGRMYVYVYVYTYTCLYTYMHIHISYKHTHTYTCTYTYIYIYIYVSVCGCMNMYVVYMQGASRYVHVEDIQDASRHVYVTIHAQSVSLYVCIYIYIYTYIYIYIYMYVCTYVRMYACIYIYIYIYMYGWMCAVWGWVGGLWTKLHDEPALRNLISPEPPFAFDDLFGGAITD